MDKWKKRSVDLITSLMLGCDGSPSTVPYYPQKTRISGSETRAFPRATPEKHGISSRRIYQLLCELELESRAVIHNLVIICDGEVISECSRDGYDVNTFHLSHSMSKTVTGMAIGMLVDEGKLSLSEKIINIFPEYSCKDRKFPAITVEHLLNMTTGVDFSELASITESRWTETYFRSAVKYAPGSKFNYNSMNTYILARIVERRAGVSFEEYLRKKFFEPLGIQNYFWEKSPEGCEKGGWGLYLSAESWAKIGYMFLSGGEYFGKRILSEEWVRESSSVKARTSTFNGDFDYGYQMWVDSKREEVIFNGMLGQNVWICPKNKIVAVIMGGNNEIFRETCVHETVRRYLGGDFHDELHMRDVKLLHEKERGFCDHKMWVRPRTKAKGLWVWLGLKPKRAFDEAWSDILGSYTVGKNSASILPLVTAAMQNNFDSKIEAFAFVRHGDEFFVLISERKRCYKIPIGLYEHKSAVLDFNGEKYIVHTLAEVREGLDGEREYRIEIKFPELPNTRMISIRRTHEGGILHMRISEMPNDKIIENLLTRLSELSAPIAFGVDLIEKKFGDGIIYKTVERTFNPTLLCVLDSHPDSREIINEYNRRLSVESSKAKLIRAFVDRFFKENADEKEDAPPEKKSIFSEVIDKISKMKKQKK